MENLLNLKYEKEIWDSGKSSVAGIDEAGRGPLAGPVVAAAVVFHRNSELIAGIHDSKKLTDKKRETLFNEIKTKAKAVGIGIVDANEIDRINILQATYKAMHQAIVNLKLKVDFLLIDGRSTPEKIAPQKAIIGGDRKCYSIAAASIIAKVYRDRLMRQYDSVFPGYGFGKHKGYGTKSHCEAIEKLRPSLIHRKTFKRVKEFVVDLQKEKNTRLLGRYGEHAAALYLFRKGYEIIERNYHFGAYGELDIIARKNDTLCFVEVKTQRRPGFGAPETWVDEKKMTQLGQIAEAYLSENPNPDLDCRFDVVAISMTDRSFKIKHLTDAFRL